MKVMRVFYLVSIFLLATALIIVATGFRWNWTSSAPIGLWRINNKEATVGDLVIICPPPLYWIRNLVEQNQSAPGYCSSGTVPFIKKVAAIGGDSFRITLDGVFVNGELMKGSKPVNANYITHNREGIVGDGDVLVVSTYLPQSIDSRYFGTLNIKDSNARTIEPVWLW